MSSFEKDGYKTALIDQNGAIFKRIDFKFLWNFGLNQMIKLFKLLFEYLEYRSK